uniref:Uncharacterized protein n=1 Tax=Tanacetum cinerariifolium TaxID=118510 RepID=A0A6L2M4H3_TANCI|nr:hypothetical protein [Tanacetum cinerariifolium]
MLMMDWLSIVETDKMIYTVETNIVKLVVEIESFGMSSDKFDEETGSSDGLQPKQADLSYVHALNELHLHEIHVVLNERVVLANFISNLKLDIDENKKIQKQLWNENTSLTHELKECKSTLEETNRTLGESNRFRDRYLAPARISDMLPSMHLLPLNLLQDHGYSLTIPTPTPAGFYVHRVISRLAFSGLSTSLTPNEVFMISKRQTTWTRRKSPRESVGSNDMVHNYYLEEARNKARLQKDKALNTKPSVQQSTRLPNTANGHHP